MFTFRGQHKVLLWLAALAILCFLAALYPELRRHLWWAGPPTEEAPG